MDVFRLISSKTRLKILKLFLANPEKAYYLRQLARELSLSAGNVRRELVSLTQAGLFIAHRNGKLLYFKINKQSPYWILLKSLMRNNSGAKDDSFVDDAFAWVLKTPPPKLADDVACETRDIFNARLSTFTQSLESFLGNDAYLLGAVVGEIGNNSYDHNLGSWLDSLGIYFAHDGRNRIIVLADRGQGILATIRNVRPGVRDDIEALRVAFTEVISGRSSEKRGNGLKFVRENIEKKNWGLQFSSGQACLTIAAGRMTIKKAEGSFRGCLAVIKY